MTYLKSFIIGSSYPVFASFYYAVYNNQPKKTYTYYDFTSIEWLKYYLYIFIKYMIVWNLIIYSIEKYI